MPCLLTPCRSSSTACSAILAAGIPDALVRLLVRPGSPGVTMSVSAAIKALVMANGWVEGAQWAVERGAKVAMRPRGLMKAIHGRKSAMLRWLLDGGHVCPDFACIIGATLAREEE